MFDLKADNLGKSRRGYLFTYAQVAFNQFRRFANLQNAAAEHEQEQARLRERLLAAVEKSERVELEAGWRTFTREHELRAEVLECKILSVLASAFFLEAYIWDYCARKESGRFAEFVDKLDPVAKWIVIPRLIVPPGLDSGDAVFGQLRQLFRLRNDLAHHKTKQGEDFETPPEFPADLEPPNCIRLMMSMLQLLHDLDPVDAFTGFVLRHIASWDKYTTKDSGFYPILWEV
jgi:hypothetical protein